MDQLSAQEGPQPNSSVTEANNSPASSNQEVKPDESVIRPLQGSSHLSESAHEAHAQVSAEDERKAREIIDRLNQFSDETPSQSPQEAISRPETAPVPVETPTPALRAETTTPQPEASAQPAPMTQAIEHLPTNVVELPKPTTTIEASQNTTPIVNHGESPLSEPLSELEARRDEQLSAAHPEETKLAA